MYTFYFIISKVSVTNYTVTLINLCSLGSNAIDLPTERGGVFPSEEEELVQLEPLLRTLKPKPHPLPPPSLPIKKSSSTG